jgi:hypothetical protein
MPRTNKVTERLFTDLTRKSVESFLNLEDELGLQEPASQAAMKERYRVLAEEFIGDLEDLAIIENIIVQMRCKLVIESELRLSLSRNYIYARSLFYRRGHAINDIRVIVGLTDDHGDNIEELIKDPIFRDVCTSTLLGAMDREIEKNILQLNKVYSNE